jgi:hypothetical protein
LLMQLYVSMTMYYCHVDERAYCLCSRIELYSILLILHGIPEFDQNSSASSSYPSVYCSISTRYSERGMEEWNSEERRLKMVVCKHRL